VVGVGSAGGRADDSTSVGLIDILIGFNGNRDGSEGNSSLKLNVIVGGNEVDCLSSDLTLGLFVGTGSIISSVWIVCLELYGVLDGVA
jgi:hypothetical protein